MSDTIVKYLQERGILIGTHDISIDGIIDVFIKVMKNGAFLLKNNYIYLRILYMFRMYI